MSTPKEKRPLASKALDSAESGEASPRTPRGSSSVVEQLRDLLGNDVVLLPIKRGNKGPSGKAMYGWENFTAVKMQEPEYLARLNHGANIGVLLGGGRVTIDLDRDENVEPFLNRNPTLRETLRSRRKRGCNLWVRIKGAYPKSCKLKTRDGAEWGELRADGNQTVIFGEAIDRKKGEKEATAYKILNRAKPVEIAFDEIRWPPELVMPWLSEPLATTNGQSIEELRRRYGEPYYSDERGNPRWLNESFWAGLFASENITLWEPAERAFYAYNGASGIYVEESVDAIKRRLSDRLLEASRQTNCPWLEKQRSDSRLNSIVAHMRGIVERRDAFAHDQERRIHLANGVFSFENNGELLEFSPAFVSRNRSPIFFDENAACPRFLDELVRPVMHSEDVPVFQKFFGQCIFGFNITQRLLILEGPDDRGKTQIANVVGGVVGRENVTQLRTKLLEERFEIFRLLKKTLLVGVDVKPDFLSTKGAYVLKGLVGGDWFDAEQKGGTGSFPVQGVFNAIITSNSRLRVKLFDDVGAWRRRLLKIQCEGEKPKTKIPHFAAVLVREEGPGILNWCIAGFALLLRDIKETGDIVLPLRQKKVVDSLLAESDSLRLFLHKAVAKAAGADVSVNEIVERYAAFCPEKGWNPLPITEIHHSLEGLMLELFQVTKSHCIKRDGGSVRGFFGVTFKK